MFTRQNYLFFPIVSLIFSIVYFIIINFDSGIPELLLSLQLLIPNNEQIYSLCSLMSVLPAGIKLYENADSQKLAIITENKNKSGVYLWTHKGSSKKYIGSAVDLSKRLYNYYLLSYITHHSKNSYIYKALIAHGYSAFSLSILEYIDSSNVSKDELKDLILKREQYYIDLFKPEYNILPTAGSSMGFKHSEETKKQLSDLRKGKYSKEDNPFYGKSHTSENIKLLSEIAKARPKSPNAKSVILTDSEHNFIQEFKSMTALSLYLRADKAKLAEYRNKGILFRDKYYIKPVK